MKRDPRSDLNNLLAQTLTFNFRVPNEEAQRVAAQVGEFLVVEDVGDKHDGAPQVHVVSFVLFV